MWVANVNNVNIQHPRPKATAIPSEARAAVAFAQRVMP